ncbi:UNVERIFIED_CONTAM: YLP motif-containing protein 1 [Sesamum radiatum]|uniref:YLP motif-containing protein 1 n=1 Tax=Sesamum radiatum TaxID=300843 RepID=A0AAW2PHB5_SESRA
MDEYFMTEVEKVEQSDGSRSSGSVRGKRPVMKKVMEYCYEPEMEEAYRSSMLKAFKKTLDEGAFPFVIVDDRNLRVADFAQFWATAKRSGYEVYLLEATYKDPVGCAARNVHGFTQTDIDKMANQWEEAPALYLKLDVKRSNPLPEEEKLTQRSGESRRRNIFQEQLRAEREAFKAAFDKRRPN